MDDENIRAVIADVRVARVADNVRLKDVLAALTRRSPEFVYIGEIRDPGNAAALCSAASTGKRVYATVCAAEPAVAANRILSAPERHGLASKRKPIGK
jgi:type II secretory ATPase GspE/PulE/Tfp pilus assembly ATPase PilB-like protein